MYQLFLCYRRDGAQTAKLLSFYLNKNYPDITVWYSDGESDGHYTHDIGNLIGKSYGAVIFITKNFTKGFLTKSGEINAICYGSQNGRECVTVQEIIEIEKNAQVREDFKITVIHLDGEILTTRDQKTLESVFKQAGIYTPQSVSRYAQRNFNPFFIARDHEVSFFQRTDEWFLPYKKANPFIGNFVIGRNSTTVDLVCWDCKSFISMSDIRISLIDPQISMHQRVERLPIYNEQLRQDDDVFCLVGYDKGLTSNDEKQYVNIQCKLIKYHLFKKTLELWKTYSNDFGLKINGFFMQNETERIYEIPNALGMAFMVVTADHKLVFSRRSKKRKIRSHEFDCSIVEGLLPNVNKGIQGAYSYLDEEYVQKECRRSYYEEICCDESITVKLFGLVLDRQYGQWNLVGMMESKLTSGQIKRQHPKRDDPTEETELYFVDYLDEHGRLDLNSVSYYVKLFRSEGFWDMALVVVYGTLLSLGFSKEMVEKMIE